MPVRRLKTWFFSLTQNLRVVIVGLIAMVLLWMFVTPFYLALLEWLEGINISGWWTVVIAAIGLAIFGKYGHHLLKV